MNIAVIFAGGVGKRMHTKDKPKQFLEVCNKPVLIYTLEHFENNPEIDAIVIACVPDWINYTEELVYRFRISKVKKIVPGGKTGQDSIYNGLCAAESISTTKNDIVLIHDGVRPLISSQLITKNIKAVKEYGSAITSGIVKETIVIVNNQNNVQQVEPREHCRVAKAPQSFLLNEILTIHRKAIAEGKHEFIDSCTMMQSYGKTMHMIEGPNENIKITTPEDYYTMRAVIQAREDQQIYGL